MTQWDTIVDSGEGGGISLVLLTEKKRIISGDRENKDEREVSSRMITRFYFVVSFLSRFSHTI